MCLTIRKATLSDSKRLFLWRNEKRCRGNSFSNLKIDYASHENWLKNKLLDKYTEIYILQDSENLIGQIRVEFDNGEGLLSYSIDKKSRGRGYGVDIVRLLEEKYMSEGKKLTLVGYVRKENIVSCKVFDRLNYKIKELVDRYKYYKEI